MIAISADTFIVLMMVLPLQNLCCSHDDDDVDIYKEGVNAAHDNNLQLLNMVLLILLLLLLLQYQLS